MDVLKTNDDDDVILLTKTQTVRGAPVLWNSSKVLQHIIVSPSSTTFKFSIEVFLVFVWIKSGLFCDIDSTLIVIVSPILRTNQRQTLKNWHCLEEACPIMGHVELKRNWIAQVCNCLNYVNCIYYVIGVKIILWISWDHMDYKLWSMDNLQDPWRTLWYHWNIEDKFPVGTIIDVHLSTFNTRISHNRQDSKQYSIYVCASM